MKNSFLAELPFFIISFNRLEYLRNLVLWLEHNNYSNIIIVDNASTYPPLIDYLASSPHRVERISENLGHLAIWKCGKFDEILKTSYYFVTDPDVIPIADCPPDSAQVFYDLLQQHPKITKVGFSLKIDDIPLYNGLRKNIIAWEKKFWSKPLANHRGYFASIDTTFALYRPNIWPNEEKWFLGIRTAPPYTAQHLPWYEQLENNNEELSYYKKNISHSSSYWGANTIDELKDENIQLRKRIYELEIVIDFLKKSPYQKCAYFTFSIFNFVKKSLKNICACVCDKVHNMIKK